MDALSRTSELYSQTNSPVPKPHMPSLEEVLRILADAGRIAHLTLVPSKKDYQASFRETGASGYRVEIRKTPTEALLAALGPKYGDSWEHHLATPAPRKAPKIRDIKKREKLQKEDPYDEDIEDLL